ncbi:MAG: hypothetical protein IKV14_04430 [Muribaculaceae bacterium]|nr:hypothetical protein [Muribaculaceae bacterium]
MKKILFMMAIALGLLVSSCGITQQATQNVNELQTQVVLTEANYQVVGTATAELTQKYVFGFGGISKKALGQSAMSAMMKNADLQGGARAIINANVEYDVVSYLGIYTKVTATATGTIIEFTK